MVRRKAVFASQGEVHRMAKDRATSSDPIRLSFRSEKRVMVEPEDEDRFFVTMREAAQACKQAQDDKQWQEKFNEFLVYLESWGEANANRLSSVLVSVGDGALNILICTPSDTYDEELDDPITALDLDLVKRFPWLVAEVMQVPSAAQGDRAPYEKAILVYGDGRPTQTTVGT
jgi:hypothetical protein